jgi:nucleoside-diphosphate-sugar epimerase
MDKFRILIAGCGDVGSALANLLCDNHLVYALRRSEKNYVDNIHSIQADLLNPDSLTALPEVDIVVYCLAPGAQDSNKSIEQRYQETYIDGFTHLVNALPNTPKRIFFTSSTSVYAQGNHEWVNEESPTEPKNSRGQLMLNAEQQVLNNSAPATVVRFSGIYAFNRLHLLNQVMQGKVSPIKPTQYTNRIHRDDCALVLAHLISLVSQQKPIEDLYLASDDEPAGIGEVSHYLAAASNSAIKSQSEARSTPSKRCDNSRLKASGFVFRYPDYKVGYHSILQQLADSS